MVLIGVMVLIRDGGEISGWGVRGALLAFGDRLGPSGLRCVAAVAVHQGQMGHETVGSGAVPVLFTRRGVERVAGVGLEEGAVAAADQGDAVEDVQGLPQAVRVPVRPCTGANLTIASRACSRLPASMLSIHTCPVKVADGPVAVGWRETMSMVPFRSGGRGRWNGLDDVSTIRRSLDEAHTCGVTTADVGRGEPGAQAPPNRGWPVQNRGGQRERFDHPMPIRSRPAAPRSLVGREGHGAVASVGSGGAGVEDARAGATVAVLRCPPRRAESCRPGRDQGLRSPLG